jgi:hypothetical protein
MLAKKPFGRRVKQLRAPGLLAPLAALLLVFLVSCAGAPRYQGRPGGSGPDRKEIVQFAKTFVGAPYRSGGTGYKGVDCSGLVFAVFREFDIRLPRTSSDQSRAGELVDRSGLKPADLVFFKTSKKASVTHVGIYVGGGQFIHASASASGVRLDRMEDVYYRKRFIAARRVLGLWRPELASKRNTP